MEPNIWPPLGYGGGSARWFVATVIEYLNGRREAQRKDQGTVWVAEAAQAG